MRIRTPVVVLVVCSLLFGSSAMAQQRHIVDPAALRQAIADQAVTDQQNRNAVMAVLQRSPVFELAGRLGLSVTRAEGALATLDSADLARLAVPARVVDMELAGGANETIVISVTTLLLIIIIVLLVAN